jgi:hypothetical protein
VIKEGYSLILEAIFLSNTVSDMILDELKGSEDELRGSESFIGSKNNSF